MSAWFAKFRKGIDCLLARCALQGAPERGSDGARAEHLAELHLVAHGARILARNVRCKGGEIDLIAEHAGAVAFIEVRLRSWSDFGGAAASITPVKQRRIVLAAKHWLQSAGRKHRNRPCRFDAILLDALDETRVRWLQAAFMADKT